MIKLNVGALVMLNSGSFPMTVFEIRNDGIIHTVWMNGAVPMRDAFYYTELVELTTKDIEFVVEAEA